MRSRALRYGHTSSIPTERMVPMEHMITTVFLAILFATGVLVVVTGLIMGKQNESFPGFSPYFVALGGYIIAIAVVLSFPQTLGWDQMSFIAAALLCSVAWAYSILRRWLSITLSSVFFITLLGPLVLGCLTCGHLPWAGRLFFVAMQGGIAVAAGVVFFCSTIAQFPSPKIEGLWWLRHGAGGQSLAYRMVMAVLLDPSGIPFSSPIHPLNAATPRSYHVKS